MLKISTRGQYALLIMTDLAGERLDIDVVEEAASKNKRKKPRRKNEEA